MRFDVITTTGGSAAAIVPSSGHGHREVRQDLEEERLELVVGAVELVHEQDGPGAGANRPQQGPLDEELRPVQLGYALADRHLAFLQRPRVEELARVVPLVERLRGVDPLVALEPDQVGLEDAGERLPDLGLADPRLPFEEQRPAHRDGQEDRGREAPVGQVVLPTEGPFDVGDRSKCHPGSVTGDKEWK